MEYKPKVITGKVTGTGWPIDGHVLWFSQWDYDKMHRSEDVEAVTNDLVYTVRSMIMALPGRLAMDVVQVASANEASALIRAECYKILNELANYNYDPAVYQRRVRDREGWSDVIVAADEVDD